MLRAAVERELEIIGEALSQLARLDAAAANRISDYHRSVDDGELDLGLGEAGPSVSGPVHWESWSEILHRPRARTLHGSHVALEYSVPLFP